MEDKHLPSREEMIELRQQGKVPWSRASVRCIMLAAISGVLLWYLNTPHEGPVLPQLFFNKLEEPMSFVTLGMVMVIVTSVASLTCGFLVSMAQTRFFVSSRLFVSRFHHPGAPGISSIAMGLVIGLSCSLFLAYRYVPAIFALLMRGHSSMEQDFALLANDLMRVLVVGAVLLAILSAVASRFMFRWNNRVARGEVNSNNVRY